MTNLPLISIDESYVGNTSPLLWEDQSTPGDDASLAHGAKLPLDKEGRGELGDLDEEGFPSDGGANMIISPRIISDITTRVSGIQRFRLGEVAAGEKDTIH